MGDGAGDPFVAIAFATLLLAYFYLRLVNPVWPPGGSGAPGLVWAVVAAALVIGSARAVAVARARLDTDDQRGFVLGLGAALGLALAGAAVQLADVVSLGLGWTESAYASIFQT